MQQFVQRMMEKFSLFKVSAAHIVDVSIVPIESFLQQPVTIRGVQVHEQLLNWQLSTKKEETKHRRILTFFSLAFKVLGQSSGDCLLSVW